MTGVRAVHICDLAQKFKDEINEIHGWDLYGTEIGGDQMKLYDLTRLFLEHHLDVPSLSLVAFFHQTPQWLSNLSSSPQASSVLRPRVGHKFLIMFLVFFPDWIGV